MRALTFESRETVSQAEFAAWMLSVRDDYRYQLLNARVVREPPAGWPHGYFEAGLVAALGPFVKDHDLGLVFGSSQGFELPTEDTIAADASFVSHERWAKAEPPVEGKFLRLVPDVVFEILSPSTGSIDRGEKKAIYARCGVLEYWLIDPRARQVVRFVHDGQRFDGGSTFESADLAKSAVLDGFAFRLDDLR